VKYLFYSAVAVGGFILWRRFARNLDWKNFSDKLMKPGPKPKPEALTPDSLSEVLQ
jgi:hypothetical protein